MTVHSGERKRGRISIGTNRRAFLKSAGVVGVAAASSFGMASLTRAESRTIKIGYIGAQSGVGANFGEATPWTVERIRAAVKDGVKIGGKSYAVELVIKDNQSDPNRSTVVSSELILRDKCDLVLCFGGDPAAAMGELADTRGVPTISTMVPWTGWKFSRGATPEDLTEKSFPYTFHFFLLGRGGGRQELPRDVEQRPHQQDRRHVLRRQSYGEGLCEPEDGPSGGDGPVRVP